MWSLVVHYQLTVCGCVAWILWNEHTLVMNMCLTWHQWKCHCTKFSLCAKDWNAVLPFIWELRRERPLLLRLVPIICLCPVFRSWKTQWVEKRNIILQLWGLVILLTETKLLGSLGTWRTVGRGKVGEMLINPSLAAWVREPSPICTLLWEDGVYDETVNLCMSCAQ